MNLGSPGVTSVNRLAKKTVLSLKDYLFCPRGAGESPSLRAEGTLKIGEPIEKSFPALQNSARSASCISYSLKFILKPFKLRHAIYPQGTSLN